MNSNASENNRKNARRLSLYVGIAGGIRSCEAFAPTPRPDFLPPPRVSASIAAAERGVAVGSRGGGTNSLFRSTNLRRRGRDLESAMNPSGEKGDDCSGFSADSAPSRRGSQSHPNISDEAGEMDLVEMDYNLDDGDELFFNSVDIPRYDDDEDYINVDDAGELMGVLEGMLDDSHPGMVDYEGIDDETFLELLGLPEDEEALSGKSANGPGILSEWDRYASEEESPGKRGGIANLERALMEGVVPADAGVGSGVLPGDFGFDPLELSTKDYFKQIQNFILNALPERKGRLRESEIQSETGAAMQAAGFVEEEDRPPALILRDYKEAEIRHGRLAMLAAVIWPMQEILDRIFLPGSYGSMTVIYGGPTLPFLPLIMTFFMLNLGYLDIYSTEIKENESGDAFLPGECFWDPLSMMVGAPDLMLRNMQEREILNGRAAMLAVAAFIFEEAMTHTPVIMIPGNELLFTPGYQVSYIQAWLDSQFGAVGSSTILFPEVG